METTSCGACDQDQLDALTKGVPSVANPDRLFDLEHIIEHLNNLRSEQVGFQKTGGMHAAGLLDMNGKTLVMEDIGRHNAVDKAYGAWYQHTDAPADVLLLSGRCGWDIVAKLQPWERRSSHRLVPPQASPQRQRVLQHDPHQFREGKQSSHHWARRGSISTQALRSAGPQATTGWVHAEDSASANTGRPPRSQTKKTKEQGSRNSGSHLVIASRTLKNGRYQNGQNPLDGQPKGGF